MKKLPVLIAIIFSSVIYANGQTEKNRTEITPEQQAERITERMTEKIGLTPDQQKEVYKIHLENAEKRKAEMAERRNSMSEQRAETKAKLEKILTEEQIAQMDKVQNEERGRRGQYQKPRGDHKREDGKRMNQRKRDPRSGT